MDQLAKDHANALMSKESQLEDQLVAQKAKLSQEYSRELRTAREAARKQEDDLAAASSERIAEANERADDAERKCIVLESENKQLRQTVDRK